MVFLCFLIVDIQNVHGSVSDICKEIGSLETGNRADIIAIDLMNPRLMPRINLIETLIPYKKEETVE